MDLSKLKPQQVQLKREKELDAARFRIGGLQHADIREEITFRLCKESRFEGGQMPIQRRLPKFGLKTSIKLCLKPSILHWRIWLKHTT